MMKCPSCNSKLYPSYRFNMDYYICECSETLLCCLYYQYNLLAEVSSITAFYSTGFSDVYNCAYIANPNMEIQEIINNAFRNYSLIVFK